MSSLSAPARTPTLLEEGILETLGPVRDPHERLALIADGWSGPGLPEAERREEDLVKGCVSPVWLRTAPPRADGRLRLEWEASSPLVRGLAGLMCAIYQETEPEAALAHRSTMLSRLGLDRQLSPTRLRGLAAVEARIHELAAALRNRPEPDC